MNIINDKMISESGMQRYEYSFEHELNIHLMKKDKYGSYCFYQDAQEVEYRNNKLREALEEIKKGDGAYDMDKLKHASNCIENMISIAEKALKEIK